MPTVDPSAAEPPLDEPGATSLVTYAEYQRITGDTTTGQSAVNQALADAQQLAEERTSRTWSYGTYDETLLVFPNGLVYPSAVPIESVSIPAGATIRGHGIAVGSLGPWSDAYIDVPWSGSPRRLDVTYSGGWTVQTLPFTLKQAVASGAYRMLHAVALAGVPAGAKSVSLGDASISGDLSAFDPFDRAAARALAKYTRRSVRA